MIAELQERYRVDEDSFISLYHILTYKALSCFWQFFPFPILVACCRYFSFVYPNLTPFPTWTTIYFRWQLVYRNSKVPKCVSAAPIFSRKNKCLNYSTDCIGRVTTTRNCAGQWGLSLYATLLNVSTPPFVIPPPHTLCLGHLHGLITETNYKHL